MEGSELYACFDPARLEDAKALFVRDCGVGIDKPARADIAARVLELKGPEKFAAKQEEQRKAEEAKAKAAAEGADADSVKSRRCLSTTVTNPRPTFRFSRPCASAHLHDGCHAFVLESMLWSTKAWHPPLVPKPEHYF